MENSPEFLIAFFALAKLGAVAVPVNTALRGALLSQVLRNGDCIGAIADSDLVERVQAVRAELPSLRQVISNSEPVDGAERFNTLLESGGAPPESGVLFPILREYSSPRAPPAPRRA